MKKYLYFTWALLLAGVLWTTGYFVAQRVFLPAKLHYHAGFVVFENNKKLDFSDNKYMNLKPCSLDQKDDDSPEEIQLEKAHLHDNVGDVVHVEREGAKWNDLFSNLKLAVNYANTTAYVNGQKVANWQSRRINPYESLVIFIGDIDIKYLKEAVTKEYMMEKEKKSDGCGSEDNG